MVYVHICNACTCRIGMIIKRVATNTCGCIERKQHELLCEIILYGLYIIIYIYIYIYNYIYIYIYIYI